MGKEDTIRNYKSYKIRYKNKGIVLIYCNFKNFEWSCIKTNGAMILCINANYSLKYKSKILHKVISQIL